MPNYDWSCHVCESSVGAGIETCTVCGAPSSLNSDEITSRKNNWQSQEKAHQKQKYKCVKCESTEYEHGQIRASSGTVSAIFEVDNKRFTHITCKNCGYTEFYKHNVGVSESIIDYLIN